MERSSVERPPAAGPRRAGVLVVDDQPSFLALLLDLVGATRRLEVVGRADSGAGAVGAAEGLRPDVVLMDVRMPGLDGIEAARRIRTTRPATVIVLVSATRPEDLPREAGESVADAVICKGDLRPALLDEIWLRHAAGTG